MGLSNALVHKISEPFIKVEDTCRRHRPQFRRLSHLPVIRFHGVLGLGVFEKSNSYEPDAEAVVVEPVSPAPDSNQEGGSGAVGYPVVSQMNRYCCYMFV